MSDRSCLYKILGVPKNAAINEIKKAYRKLAKKFHPDKNAEAGDKFKEISFAYDILSDPAKKDRYDRFGLSGVQNNDNDDPADILNYMQNIFPGGIFGMPGMGPMGMNMGMGMGMGLGMGGPMGMSRPKMQDTVTQFRVTLEDIYNGRTVQVSAPKDVTCPTCKGRGAKTGAAQKCTHCDGRGMQLSYRMGSMVIRNVACTACGGEGEFIRDRDRCGRCKGSKTVQEEQTLEVHVEQGVRNNAQLRFPGRGDQVMDALPGDYVLIVREAPHERFRRVGNNLVMDLSITLTEALCGFQHVVEHLDGTFLSIRTQPGETIKPGAVKQVTGMGMPVHGDPATKGDLVVYFALKFPDNHFCDLESLTVLESLLPPRPAFIVPEDFEEVNMFDYHPEEGRENGELFYESDDESNQGTQCHQQ